MGDSLRENENVLHNLCSKSQGMGWRRPLPVFCRAATLCFSPHCTNCTAAPLCLLWPRGEGGGSAGSSPPSETSKARWLVSVCWGLSAPRICGKIQPRSSCESHGVMWPSSLPGETSSRPPGLCSQGLRHRGQPRWTRNTCTRNPLRNGGCCVGARSLRSSVLAQIQDQAVPGNSSASAQRQSLPLLSPLGLLEKGGQG